MIQFKRFLFFLSTIIFILTFVRDGFSLKDKHAHFLHNSPYKNTKKLSRKDRKALGIPPNAYNERFFELTMNPSLGYPTVSKKFELQNRLSRERNGNINPNKNPKNQDLSSKTPGADNLNPWISVGPNDVGGRTRGALFDLNDNEKDRVIAGGVSGGLWVNEDIDASGTSPWTEVTGVPGNLAVSVIVQDPNHTNVMYAGTGESYTGADAFGNGVYKSTDYGQNWTLVLGNATGTATTTSFDATRQFVEGYFFINDLQIWDPTPSDTSNNDEYIFALLGQGSDSTGEITEFFDLSINGLYLSTDGGSVWSKIALPSDVSGKDYHLNDIEVDPNNNKIWISSNFSRWGYYSGGNFYWSSDGANFTKITPSYPSNANTNIFRVEFAASAITSDTFYVLLSTIVSSQAEIYKTVDGFSTLTKLNEPNDADTGIPSTDFTRGQSFYDLEIEVDPNNEDIVYVGGIDLFRSVDGGTNWSQISKWSNNNNLAALPVSKVHADQHGIYFKPGDSDKGMVVNDGGVYYVSSLSSAATSSVFTAQESGFVTSQFYKVAQSPHDYATDMILGGTQDNGTLLLQNSDFSGLTSSTEFTGGDGGFSYIDQVDTKYRISNYVYNDAVYLSSLNNTTFSNGLTYLYLSSSWDGDSSDDTEGDFINPGALDSNQDILYVNGSKSGSYKIRCFYDLDTNAPDDYYITGLPSEPSAFHVSTHTTTSTTLLVGTDDGKILLITDADNINLASTQIADFIGSVSNLKFGANENEIYASLYNYGVNNVYFSNDRGVSWTAKDGDLPDIPVLAIQPNPFNPEEVILGTDLGVWMTTNFSNNSPTWVQSNNGMTDVRVNDFEVTGTSVANNRIVASTYGRGIFVGSFTSDDLSNPTVTLTTTDADNLVSNTNVVTITATFSESMSATPTLSLTGLVTDVLMDATASNAIWTYTWTVSTTLTSTTATVSGTDLSSNAYSGSDSINFTIDNTEPERRYGITVYESFEYNELEGLENQNGGSGWNGAWIKDSNFNNHYILSPTTFNSGGGGVYQIGRRSPMTYTGLTVAGNYLGDDGNQTDVTNSNYRNLYQTLGSDVYIQFLVQFNDYGDADNGNAKSNYFILKEGDTQKLVIRRKNGRIYMGKTTSSSAASDLVDTGVNLPGSAAAQLVIVKIDDADTKIWVDPNLSTFDYENPPTENASLNYTFQFNRIQVQSQIKYDFGIGTLYDEIYVYEKRNVLTDTDADDIVMNTDVVTITATFSEDMAATPTLSLSGIVSNANMTATASNSIWTYTWTVSTTVTSTTVTVAGTDVVGNVYTGTDSITFQIDNSEPTLTISTNDNQVNATDTATLTFTLTESSTSFTGDDISVSSGSLGALTATSSKVYTASYTPASATVTSVTISVLSAVFTDIAGNANTASSTTFEVDTISPTLSAFTTDHADLYVGDADTVIFTATFSEAMTSSPSISITGVVTQVTMTVSTTSSSKTWIYSWDVPAANDGVVTATVSGTDVFGNSYSGTESITLTIDNILPTITLTEDDADDVLIVGESVLITASADESISGTPTLTITFSGINTDVSMTASSSSWIYSYTPPANATGTVTYTVTLNDLVGYTVSSTLALTVDTLVPTLARISSPMADGTYTDDDGNVSLSDTVTITVTFTEAVVTTGTPRVVLNTSPLSYANYVQGSGTTTLTFASLIAQEVYQPSLDVTSIDLNGGTIADINSNTASISLSYAIANNTTLVDLTNIRLDSKNPILSSYTVSDTNNLAPVATASVGDGDVVTYYFNSDKELLSNSLTVSFTGFNPSLTTSVTGAGPYTYSFSFTVSSSFPEGNVLFQADSATDKVSSTHVASGNPISSFNQAQFNDLIKIDRTAPVFTSNSSLNSNENVTTGPTLSTNETSYFSIIGGADQALLSINQTSGVLSFNTAPDYENPVDNATDNTYEIVVKATDQVGLTATQTITIQINNIADTFGVEITQNDVQTTESGETASLSFILITQPTANVVIGLSLSDTSEGILSLNQLRYTPAQWNVRQTLTITGLDDGLADGDVSYQLITAAVVSEDVNYNGLGVADITLINIDDEIDTDGDGSFDYADAFINDVSEWLDTDRDGIGNNADLDDDADGISDVYEIRLGTDPLDANETPPDFNSNGIPDALEDSDGDGVNDDVDDSPLDPTLAFDNDGDGISDQDDPDDDNDGVLDVEDDFPFDSRYRQDTDKDGYPNLTDADDDNDGVYDEDDAFPLDSSEQTDTDKDGLGDNADLDDDEDGVLDIFDYCPDTPLDTKVDQFGCAIFSLPTDSITLSKTEKCAGENKITIGVVDTSLTYNVAISGAISTNESFMGSRWSVDKLSAGVYVVCVTVEGISTTEFERCFEVTITEPEPLLVSSLLNTQDQTVSFNLSGGSTYQITQNGKTVQTNSNKYSLSLEKGMNNISISTGIECQGLFEKSYFNSHEVQYAPNPFNEYLQLYFDGEDSWIELDVYTANGQHVEHQNISLSPGIRSYNLKTSNYKQGLYIIKIKGENIDKTLQVIKE